MAAKAFALYEKKSGLSRVTAHNFLIQAESAQKYVLRYNSCLNRLEELDFENKGKY